MQNILPPARRLAGAVLMSGLAVGFSGAAIAGDALDPAADKILREMTSLMAGMSAFSVDMDVDTDVLDTNGRKLKLSASTSLLVQRPDKVYAHRHGPVADLELFADGKTLTVYGKGLNVFAQWNSEGGIDAVIDQVRSETGLEAPAGDLIYSNAYAGLMDGVVSGTYVGIGFVDGVECHHLAYRQDSVDWQVWVQTGDTPLPMKYVITSKWVTGAPEYTVRFHDWNRKPDVTADRFTFTAPADGKQIDAISLDALGQVMVGGNQ
jgi:hypothetical protein